MSVGHSRPGYSAPHRRRRREPNVRGTFAPWLFGAVQAQRENLENKSGHINRCAGTPSTGPASASLWSSV